MQMAQPTDAHRWYRSRWFLPLSSVAMGAVIWIAQAIGGDVRGGAVSFAIMAGYGAVLFAFSNRSDLVAVLSGRARDERYQSMDLQAVAITGMVLVTAIIGGFLWQIGHGRDPNPYGWLGGLGGVTYIAALVYQRFRN